MIGAPALAANAALRGGAGLAIVACPATVQLSVAALCPCATSIPLPDTARGSLDPKRAQREFQAAGLFSREGAPSVVAAGPGLSRGNAAFDDAWLALLHAFGAARVPLVLDADGLNAWHKSGGRRRVGWDTVRHYRTIITPHPGEMARLHETTTAAVQADREGFAVRTAQQLAAAQPNDSDYQPVVVLKGAGTIVTDGRRIYVNRTGNPGMATGGSGDVLTGLIAALIGQGLSCLDAAVLGVYLHGLAGDLAAQQLGEESLTAADLIDFLPAAFRRCRAKCHGV
jgi:ADP-dependent NAD(P)H-hydrate dehydratase